MFQKLGADIFQVVSFGRSEPAFLGVGGWIGPWRVWQHVLEILSQERRCIAYDHRGAGKTSASVEKVSFQDHVNDVFRIMDAMQVDRCWLGGESNGGAVAAAAALRDPSRFLGLAVIASSPFIDPKDERAAGFADRLEADHDRTLRRFVEACIPEPDCEPLRDWLFDLLCEPGDVAGVHLLRAMKADIRGSLAQISIPAVVIHGSLDVIQSPENGRMFAGSIPGATFVEIADAGHVPTITRADQVAAILQEFMGGRRVSDE